MGLHWVYSYDKEDDEGSTSTTATKKIKKKKNRWTRDTLERQLKDFFTLIENAGKVQLLVYLETTATHFDALGGDYSLARKTNPNFDTSSCVPLTDNDTSEKVSKWREPIVRRAAKLANYSIVETGQHMPSKYNDHNNNNQHQQQQQKEMYILPYYDFTAPLWKMHPHREGPNGAHLDCSHYCSSPYLFLPIWKGIRYAMDREFATG